MESYDYSSSSDEGILTSDDETEVSKSVIYKWYNNRYFAIKYLGRGTFCRVWLVYDIINYTFYAMKIYFPKYYEDSLHELKINNKLKTTTYIVKCYDNFVLDKSNVLIYELMGITLLDIMDIYDNLIPIDIVKKITLNILKGLHELHSNRIIHCDLKPENIMFKQLTPTISNIINTIQKLNLKNLYEITVLKYLPNDYNECDKCKKKNIKRKIKIKTLKLIGNVVKLDVEKLTDINDAFIFDTNSICKLIDLGNSEIIGNTTIDEINISAYRPPENIMNEFYNEKADIWALGCILYEIFADDYLFKIDHNLSKIEQNRLHLSDIFNIFGTLPKSTLLSCDFAEELFDKNGNIINNTNTKTISLKESFSTIYNNDSHHIEIFIKKILDINVNTRVSCYELLNDSWLIN